MTDILERLIGYAAPGKGAQAAAKRLMQTQGSLGPILESAPEDLRKTPGVSAAAARLLSLVPQLARYEAGEDAKAMTVLDTFEKAGAYLKSLYIGAHNECFYLLSLDEQGRFLDCALVQQGTVDEAPFYLRRILERSARARARAVVLSHNHPSGTLEPSPQDVQCTKAAIEALVPLGILVLDHILIAGGVPVSLRDSGGIAEVLFTRQAQNHPLIQNWLNDREEEC